MQRDGFSVELKKRNDFYQVQLTKPVYNVDEQRPMKFAVKDAKLPLMQWHLRYAHLNFDYLRDMKRGHVVDGYAAVENSSDIADCFSFALAKAKRMSYRNVNPPRFAMYCEKIMADVLRCCYDDG